MIRSVQQNTTTVIASYAFPNRLLISGFCMSVVSASRIQAVTMPFRPSLYSTTSFWYVTLRAAFRGDVAASAAASADRTVFRVVLKSRGLRHDAFCAIFSVMLLSPSLYGTFRRLKSVYVRNRTDFSAARYAHMAGSPVAPSPSS